MMKQNDLNGEVLLRRRKRFCGI